MMLKLFKELNYFGKIDYGVLFTVKQGELYI